MTTVTFCNYPSLLKNIAGLVFDTSGNLYAANYGGIAGGNASYIVKIDSDGNATQLTSQVTDANYTSMVYVDGYLYVCGNNSCVYQISPTTGARTTVGNFASLAVGGTLAITYYASYFYIACTNTGSPRVVRMQKDTWTASVFISYIAGTFTSPTGITVDHAGVLYITDQATGSFSTYSSVDGSWISKFLAGIVPKYILFYNNFLFISNVYAAPISQYGLDGTLIKSTYAVGFAGTSGLAFDDEGSFYTVNTVTTNGVNTSRILKVFTPPVIACFKEDSLILTNKGYCPVQYLRKGDLIKTINHGFLPIDMIGCREINHLAIDQRIKDQLYKCSKEQYPELLEDLILTGCHSILVNEFSSLEERKKVKEMNSGLFRTENVFRLPTCLDNRACVYEIKGKYKVYHLALENVNDYLNYGIYANGLLVESCSKRCLKEYSNMKLIE